MINDLFIEHVTHSTPAICSLETLRGEYNFVKYLAENYFKKTPDNHVGLISIIRRCLNTTSGSISRMYLPSSIYYIARAQHALKPVNDVYFRFYAIPIFCHPQIALKHSTRTLQANLNGYIYISTLAHSGWVNDIHFARQALNANTEASPLSTRPVRGQPNSCARSDNTHFNGRGRIVRNVCLCCICVWHHTRLHIPKWHGMGGYNINTKMKIYLPNSQRHGQRFHVPQYHRCVVRAGY